VTVIVTAYHVADALLPRRERGGGIHNINFYY
jgi:hypothetical protein